MEKLSLCSKQKIVQQFRGSNPVTPVTCYCPWKLTIVKYTGHSLDFCSSDPFVLQQHAVTQITVSVNFLRWCGFPAFSLALVTEAGARAGPLPCSLGQTGYIHLQWLNVSFLLANRKVIPVAVSNVDPLHAVKMANSWGVPMESIPLFWAYVCALVLRLWEVSYNCLVFRWP